MVAVKNNSRKSIVFFLIIMIWGSCLSCFPGDNGNPPQAAGSNAVTAAPSLDPVDSPGSPTLPAPVNLANPANPTHPANPGNQEEPANQENPEDPPKPAEPSEPEPEEQQPPTPEPKKNETEKEPAKTEGRAVPVIKFVPGVFQLTKKKIIKGTILFGAFSAVIVGAFIENHKGNELYERYLAADDVDEIVALRKQTEQKFKNRNFFIAGAFAVWLIHLVDLELFRHKNKKGGIKGDIQKDQIHIGLYYSF